MQADSPQTYNKEKGSTMADMHDMHMHTQAGGPRPEQAQQHVRKAIMDAFEYRYACKKFNPEQHIPQADFDVILETGRLSPSSFGFEPWKFLVVGNERDRDRELREKLAPVSWGGKNSLRGADKYVLFLARKAGDMTAGSDYLTYMMREVKGMPQDAAEGMTAAFGQWQRNDFDLMESDRAMFDWSCKQTYIALANMMTAAAMLGIDSCPVEGFNRAAVEDVLAEEGLLDRDHFGVSVAAGFGYRAEQQPGKVRQPLKDIVQYV